jgi:zinc D-Ala-D-Ala dipeptidase
MLASRYVSPPEIAPHSAGAAIDLTLCGGDGTELDLGTPVNASPGPTSPPGRPAAPMSPASKRAGSPRPDGPASTR